MTPSSSGVRGSELKAFSPFMFNSCSSPCPNCGLWPERSCHPELREGRALREGRTQAGKAEVLECLHSRLTGI